MLTELQTVFIYALKDPRDGAVRYIGKSKNPKRRLRLHLGEAKKGEFHTYKNYWVRQLTDMSLCPALEILDEIPEAQWEFFERAYIKVYREMGAALTNLTDGGDGGDNPAPETRAKMSAARKGVPKTLEHRAAMSRAQKGRVHSEESNKKRSKTLIDYYVEHESPTLGYKHTPESCAKMSASHMGQRPSDAAISAARAVTKGVPKTPEHNAKNSAALKRVWAERKAKNVLR